MNKWVGTGRLTKDPEQRGSALSFTIAIGRNFKDKDGNYGADFINCVAFGKKAEFISKYFKKGSPIAVSGRISTGSYTDKEGKTVYTTNVSVEDAEFNGKAESSSGSVTAAEKPSAKADNDGFLNIPDSVDDLPFVN